MKPRLKHLFLIIVLLLPVSLAAFDFGLLLNQNAVVGNAGGETAFEYSAGIVPRFSVLIGDTGSFFVSAALTLGYKDGFFIVPELLRTEFSTRFGAWGLRVGRINYSDPLAFVADGLFDGVQFTHSSAAGRFGFGAWYAGLLYKKTANITMTAADQEITGAPLAYADFFNTYFAPRRMLVSLDWEHPSLGELLRLRSALTGQFDFTSADEKLHSQYLTLKMGIPVKSFLFEAGGAFAMTQSVSAADDTAFNLALAGELGFFWTLPSSFNSRLSFTARYASGLTGGLLGEYIPVTTRYSGNIFQSNFTGLTELSLDYSARFSNAIGASINVSYFIRNDLVNRSFPIRGAGNDGHFLGGEFFARFIWSPISDLQFNLGAGIFIPAMGNNWPNEKPLWRLDLTVILAVY